MNKRHFETLAIRTQVPQSEQREHSVPLYMTSSFTFESAEQGAAMFKGEESGHLYSRYGNPNTEELVNKLSLMEQAETGIVTASGMAAVYTSFAAFLGNKDHIIVSKSIFGNSKYILNHFLPDRGIEVTYVDCQDTEGWKSAFQSNTKMLFIETPANPTLTTVDMTFLGNLCKSHDVIFSVDNCFATPYLQQPVRFGADLIIHSATKYIDGQGRVLGGAILGSEALITQCENYLRRTGASLSPFNAWVLSKSLETLAIRMDRHCSNALTLAEYLQTQPDIDYVIYPHLENNPLYEIARRQMSQGGGLVGCQINGGAERGAKFLNALRMHTLTANLGDTRSIATHPASTTHSKLSSEEQLAVDITPGYLRFSVGLEHIDDIITDIDQALNATR